jgi:hypothetical protein
VSVQLHDPAALSPEEESSSTAAAVYRSLNLEVEGSSETSKASVMEVFLLLKRKTLHSLKT